MARISQILRGIIIFSQKDARAPPSPSLRADVVAAPTQATATTAKGSHPAKGRPPLQPLQTVDPCRGPGRSRSPLAGSQAMASRSCRGPGHGQPPLHADNMHVTAPPSQATPTFAANRCNKRIEQFYAIQSHYTQFKTNFSHENLGSDTTVGKPQRVHHMRMTLGRGEENDMTYHGPLSHGVPRSAMIEPAQTATLGWGVALSFKKHGRALHRLGDVDAQDMSQPPEAPTLVNACDVTIKEENTITCCISGSQHEDPTIGFLADLSLMAQDHVSDLAYSDWIKPYYHLSPGIR
ncbi:hypothetical protein GW17_00051414 [Ensete ventricosum]|nr:hypothetical protein GW17_00051414 [Ensete ventricosum]